MGISGAKFNSAMQSTQHYVPGVYSRRNTVGAGSGVSSGNLCIIGTSTGGAPMELLQVSDKAEAKELLQGGELLEAVCHAFTGSNTYIPQQVFCIRVNIGHRANLVLNDTGGGGIISLQTQDYGAQCNQVKLAIIGDNNANSVAKKVTVSYKGNENTVEGIIRQSFSLRCTDTTASSCNCTIDSNGIHLSASGGNEDIGECKVDITAGECETLAQVVEKIADKGNGKYVAILLDTDPNASPQALDYVDCNVTIGENGGGDTIFYSNVEAMLDALKTLPYITNVALVKNAPRNVVADTGGFVYFSGGTDGGVAEVGNYAEALDLLEKEDIQIITTPTSDKDVIALIADHCIQMSTVEKKKERTFIVGLRGDTTIEEGISFAKSLNTELGSVIITGATAINSITGKSEVISPSMLACKVAGMEASMGVSSPLTNKIVNVTSFSKKYTTGELNKLIQGGVMPFGANDAGELVCIRGITTYQGDNLILNERSMIRGVLYMDRDLRRAFQPRIGTNNAPNESEILGVLNNKAKEWFNDDLITNGGQGLVFNTKVIFDADKCYISFDRYIRAPNNFIFITATNRVYSSTVEL